MCASLITITRRCNRCRLPLGIVTLTTALRYATFHMGKMHVCINPVIETASTSPFTPPTAQLPLCVTVYARGGATVARLVLWREARLQTNRLNYACRLHEIFRRQMKFVSREYSDEIRHFIIEKYSSTTRIYNYICTV